MIEPLPPSRLVEICLRRVFGVALLPLILAFLIATPCLAQSNLQGENLLAPQPDGFTGGFHAHNGPESITEYVPQGQNVENWTTMITVQIFPHLTGRDPDDFAERLSKAWVATCAGGEAQKLHGGEENGYAITVWMYTCPLNPRSGRPENMWLKAIAGQDSLYSVQYAYRQPMSPELVPPAIEYLRRVSACDTRRADRPCPGGM